MYSPTHQRARLFDDPLVNSLYLIMISHSHFVSDANDIDHSSSSVIRTLTDLLLQENMDRSSEEQRPLVTRMESTYNASEGPMARSREWSEDFAIAAVATVAVLLLAFFIREKVSKRSQHRLPPGPRQWPLVGSLHLLWGTLPHQALHELSKQYGPLMFMRLGSVRTLVVTSPKLAEEILKTNDQIMATRPVQVVSKQFSYNFVDIAAAPYGQYWRYVRKVLTVGLITVHRLNQFRKIREREVLSTIHFILEECQRGYPVDMFECLSTLDMNNMTQMMMNKSYRVHQSASSRSGLPAMSTSLPELFREMLDLAGAINVADYIPLLKPFDPQGLHKRAKVVHQRLDNLFEEIIEERRQRGLMGTTGKQEDFIDVLLGIGNTKEFQERLSMDSIKALLLDILSAPESSAVSALWAMTELMRQPQVMKKAQEELDSVVGRDRLVQEEDLPELKYLNAVIKETFRLHPPGPFTIPHESTQDCEIQHFKIPAGTRVLVNLWGMHRDSAVWERPLEFDPERFLNSKVDVKGQHFELLPFGSGRRMCPGLNLGILMVLYPLSVLMQAIDWTLPEDQRPEKVDMSETFGLAVFKRVPLKVFGKARLPNHVIYPSQQEVQK